MRNKKIIISLTLIIFLNIFFINSYVTYCQSNNAISAKSAILIERDSGRILYTHDPYKKLPPASTTKIMTALIALEYGNLDQKVKINNKSIGVEGSSIYLKQNETITLRDLVYGLMLRSGNDAAVAIAYHISGSVDEFCKIMNNKAKEIGAKNTNFTNPHGLHNDNHYTTAYDLAIISREALKHEEFRKISSSTKWIADRESNNYFYNKNKTLWQYKDGDGVKIGYTKKAGRCLVSSATRNGMQLIAVVLNDGNWFNDCYTLLDYGFNNYKQNIITEKNEFVRSIYVNNGKKNILPLISENMISYPIKNGEIENIETVVKLPKTIKAPVTKGQRIGSMQIYLNGKLISSTNLVAKESIELKSKLERTIDYIKNIFD